MDSFVKMLKKYNDGLKYYVVVPSSKVMGEDGKYIEGEFVGYGVRNKETGIVELTNTCLPAAMFQANHFDDMLASMLDGTPALAIVEADTTVEDIVPLQ